MDSQQSHIVMCGLAELQRAIDLSWTLQSYSSEFINRTTPHRDFAHALGHVVKASGKLYAVIDEVEHRGELAPLPGLSVRKEIADLVICASRLASTVPIVRVDLATAVYDRMIQITERERR